MKSKAALVGVVIVLALGGCGWYWWARAHQRMGVAVAAPPDLTAPARQRIRVEVLNATRIRGLARQGTFLLRDRGFDVVSIGTSSQQTDSTQVLDRTNHPEWAQRVAQALGGARVESRPDSTLYVDVTVLLGRRWRPPPEPLHP
ncbi:MAG: LytR C-terminal domain-containing protein [Gemmatimonadaceae bacterium]